MKEKQTTEKLNYNYEDVYGKDKPKIVDEEIVKSAYLFMSQYDNWKEIFLSDFDFSIKTYINFKRAKYLTIYDILAKKDNELIKIRNSGKANLIEVYSKCAVGDFSKTPREQQMHECNKLIEDILELIKQLDEGYLSTKIYYFCHSDLEENFKIRNIATIVQLHASLEQQPSIWENIKELEEIKKMIEMWV